MTTLEWSGRAWNTGSDNNQHPGFEWEQQMQIDGKGHLHLDLVKKTDGKWYAPMLISTDHMGYGTYQIVADIHAIDPEAVLGFFTYTWVKRHEIDVVEHAQWGALTNPAFQFTVQPSDETGRIAQDRFSLAMPQENVLFILKWEPTGETFTIKDSTGKVLRTFHSDIPVNAEAPEPCHFYINLYPHTDFGKGVSYPPATDQHYVIKSFSFTPLGEEVPPPSTPVEEPPVIVVPPIVVKEPIVLLVNGIRITIEEVN